MTATAIAKPAASSYLSRLESELNGMVNDQFESAEFRYLAETPLTLERAKFYQRFSGV